MLSEECLNNLSTIFFFFLIWFICRFWRFKIPYVSICGVSSASNGTIFKRVYFADSCFLDVKKMARTAEEAAVEYRFFIHYIFTIL